MGAEEVMPTEESTLEPAIAAENPVDAALGTAAPPSRFPVGAVLDPLIVAVVLLVVWQIAVVVTDNQILPTPLAVVEGTQELIVKGVLHRYIISSLFRVIWSFLLAVAVGVPFGLLLGWSTRASQAFNPILQILRPISPIAWIPLSILWFGMSERQSMFLIFLASVFPITVAAMAAVQNIQLNYLRAARNFGLTRLQLFLHVILPATLPQILTGLRIALGIAWLVVVAAEMVVVDPHVGGLGFLINDSRSAGRYDYVVAGMVIIGVIGFILDLLIRLVERLDDIRWGYVAK